MIKRIARILLSFCCIINAQIALPTFQGVHKSHASAYESGSQTFSYTGAEQTLTVPSGVSTITIKAWGAQGGGEPATGYYGDGGKGGYSTGSASVTPGETIYIVIGQQGFQSHSTIAYNGGGGGTNHHSFTGYTGGGATHVAKVSGLLNTLSGQIANILLVGAGGGGAGGSDMNNWPSYGVDGGAGGGTTGIDGTDAHGRLGGHGGTQSAGGSSSNPCVEASFGLGATSSCSSSNWIQGGGGGGGYYGGGAGAHYGGGGGGGSSYIGGVSSSETIAGNATMPDPDGGTMTGRAGNGLVIISW